MKRCSVVLTHSSTYDVSINIFNGTAITLRLISCENLFGAQLLRRCLREFQRDQNASKFDMWLIKIFQKDIGTFQ